MANGYIPAELERAGNCGRGKTENRAFLGGVLGIDVNGERQPISEGGIVDLTFIEEETREAAEQAIASAAAAAESKQTASEAAAAALSSEIAARTAASAAEAAKDDAEDAASTSNASKNTAAAHASAAQTAAATAQIAQGNADRSSESAIAAAAQAASSAGSALRSANDAYTSASAAQDASDAAQTAQAAAEASEATASTAASTATAAKDAAQAAKTAAETAQSAATASATAASNSETAAAASATSASGSATAAAASATAADASADAADASETAAAGSATAAAASAESAAQSATEAAAFVGSPLKASTLAEMTNTNKVYVYTGEEVGMTAGHWYYYDGEYWADGGVYNGVATDDTMTEAGVAADAKAVGDILAPGEKQTNIYDNLLYFSSAYITSAGVLTQSSSWRAFILFADEINDFDSLVYSAYFASSGRKQIAFYSSLNPSNDTYIDGIAFISGNQPSVLTLNVADIPANTKSILFTNLNTSGQPALYGVKNTNNVEIVKNDSEELQNDAEKAEKAKFDGRFNYICYSDNGDSGGMSINTEEMYIWAAQHNFVGVKGDVRISSDGEIVMCHDAGFTFDADGHVISYDVNNNTKIIDLTYAECIALTHPNGQHICGIDALIRTCKIYGKIAYITVRDADLYLIMPKVFESLDKYNMRDHAIINSFTYRTLQSARKFDKSIMLSWVQTANHVITTSDIDDAVKLGNAFVCAYDYGNGAATGVENQPGSVLSYAKAKNVRIYESIITNGTSLNQLYDKGISGAQIEFLPSCLAY